MADFAGRLNIRIRRASGGARVAIESSRPVTACGVFVGLPVGDEAMLRRQAAMFITAVDPCVDYDVSIS
jgi:hypothetical protein